MRRRLNWNRMYSAIGRSAHVRPCKPGTSDVACMSDEAPMSESNQLVRPTGSRRALPDRSASARRGRQRSGCVRARPKRSSGTRRRWSAEVLKKSDALDLRPGVFKQRSARAIAASLKRSALASKRRKSEPFRSAMSMLNFEINRAGRGLSAERRRALEQTKVELRRLFGRATRS
jgi:hypothetical protein